MIWRRKKPSDTGPTTETQERDANTAPTLRDAPDAPPRERIDAGAPAAAQEPHAPSSAPGQTNAADFIAKMKAMAPRTDGARGRLIFAMDATMSRQPTWDMALALQSDMFATVRDVGGLDVQLMYFRGSGECRASKWVRDPDALARLMTTVSVAGGWTQIRKVLSHARKETQTQRVHALVYVGDSVEED
ncbi:MAG: hypothetical protein AAGG99_07840, partial [Pseudomonadota bacterium]